MKGTIGSHAQELSLKTANIVPIQGFLIDLKTRYRQELNQPEVLRKNADAFVDRSLNTDVMLLYPPAHIALAALLTAANESKVDLGEPTRTVGRMTMNST